jgi:hypothetical protein
VASTRLPFEHIRLPRQQTCCDSHVQCSVACGLRASWRRVTCCGCMCRKAVSTDGLERLWIYGVHDGKPTEWYTWSGWRPAQIYGLARVAAHRQWRVRPLLILGVLVSTHAINAALWATGLRKVEAPNADAGLRCESAPTSPTLLSSLFLAYIAIGHIFQLAWLSRRPFV